MTPDPREHMEMVDGLKQGDFSDAQTRALVAFVGRVPLARMND